MTISESLGTRRIPVLDGEATDAPGVPRLLPVPQGPSVATRVGRYVLLSELGRGSMGAVFAAYDPKLDRKVAIKLLHAEYAVQPKHRRRMVREAQALAKLSHPNVVPVYDVGFAANTVYLAMELVRGQTLRKWLRSGTRTQAEVLRVFQEAGRGLESAHRKHLVHRDFKLANVMVRESGQAVVMDFGLVRVFGDAIEESAGIPVPADAETSQVWEVHLTRVGTVMGTPAYMSPEQYRAEETDARSDQFSFCVALYEALCGVRPFQGRTTPELREAICSGRFAHPPVEADIPAWIREILFRGLSLDPKDRWPDMGALLEALSRDPTRARRRRAWVLGVGVALAVAAGGAGAWEGQRRVMCDADAERLVSAWDREARGAVVTSVRKSGALHADAALHRMLPRVDRYAAELQDAAASLCREGEISGVWSGELREHARACLEDRHRAFEALVEVMGNATFTTTPHMVEALAELPSPKDCRDAEAMGRWRGGAADEGAAVAKLRGELSRARVLGRAGDPKAALALAEQVRDRAIEHGVADLHTAALAEMADAHTRLGELEPAVALLEVVVRRAAEEGDSMAVAKAADDLLDLDGFMLGHSKAGEAWYALVRVAAADLARDDPRREQLLAVSEYHLARARGEYVAAEKAAARVYRLVSERLGDDHPRAARWLAAWAQAMARSGRILDARERYEEALDVVVRTLGPGHPDVAKVLSRMGVTYMDTGELGMAERLLEEALVVSQSARGPRHPATANLRERLARLRLFAGDPAEALVGFEQALAIADGIPGNELFAAQIRNNMANALMQLGAWGEAMRALEEASAVQRGRLGEGHIEHIVTLMNIGEVQVNMGESEAGLATLREAVDLRRRLPAEEIPSRSEVEAHLHAMEALAGNGPGG